MKKSLFIVRENKMLVNSIYKLSLEGDTSDIKAPGQFVNIELEGFYLRRPLSVCDWEDGKLTVIYKVVGNGTEALSLKSEGTRLDLLTGLGNGYDLTVSGDKPLLIGGGAGVPPLYGLAKRLIKKGSRPTVILGFNTEGEVFLENEFKALGIKTLVTTVDGSKGIKGFAAAALPETEYTYVYTCGPEPMLKAVYNSTETPGQFSFEERMGCGFGACMGCSCKTKYGYKRICREGPVLCKEEIVW